MVNLQTMRYGNGVTNLYQYDSLNRLTNSVWKLNAGTLASFYYQLGLAGNRTNVIEFVKDSWRTNQWQYDPLYRLTNETIGAPSTSSASYAYDPVGNRTNRQSTISQLPSSNSSFTTNDWLKTDAYDNNGNTLWSTNGTVQGPYFYDVENRLTTFNNTIYIAYNGDGVRVRKISGTTTNYYLVDDRNPSGYGQVLEEHQALSGQSPALKRVYNYGLDLVSQREAAGTVYYFGYDGHGSTRLLIDTGGIAVQKFSYDAYGTLIDSNTAPATVYLYGGEQFDPDLGFYYQRARYLNPNTGRFWTPDTYEGDNEDPLSLHKYLYCQANPVNGVDPSGHGMLWIKSKNKDGTTSKVRIRWAHIKDLMAALDNAIATGNLIDELHIKGHGTPDTVYLIGGGYFSASSYISYFGPAEYFYIRNGSIMTGTSDDLTYKFRYAMAPGSLIVLSGCETARGENNIAKGMSSILPGVTVCGGTGIFQESIPFSSNSLGAKNYYINGSLQLHVYLFERLIPIYQSIIMTEP